MSYLYTSLIFCSIVNCIVLCIACIINGSAPDCYLGQWVIQVSNADLVSTLYQITSRENSKVNWINIISMHQQKHYNNYEEQIQYHAAMNIIIQRVPCTAPLTCRAIKILYHDQSILGVDQKLMKHWRDHSMWIQRTATRMLPSRISLIDFISGISSNCKGNPLS